jgi:hypothetical protein
MDSIEHENIYKGWGMLMAMLRKILRMNRNGFVGSGNPWKQQQFSPLEQS